MLIIFQQKGNEPMILFHLLQSFTYRAKNCDNGCFLSGTIIGIEMCLCDPPTP